MTEVGNQLPQKREKSPFPGRLFLTQSLILFEMYVFKKESISMFTPSTYYNSCILVAEGERNLIEAERFRSVRSYIY